MPSSSIASIPVPASQSEAAVAPTPAITRNIVDFNDDGAVNSQDFFNFLTAFFASDAAADFNTDGAVNSQDFFDFLAAFFTPCP